MEGQLLPGTLPREGDAALLCGAFPDRGDQQHVLPDAHRVDAPALVERGPRELCLRAQGVALRQSSDSVGFFLAAAATLGHKLGPLLFQLPPTFKQDLPLLREFLALLPRERRAAFEFRHPSWFEDGVYEALRAHGAALCTADTGEPDDPPLLATSDWGYLRLRDEGYDDRELGGWAERIRSQPWRETFVFFKHEEQGMGPKLAARFIELAG